MIEHSSVMETAVLVGLITKNQDESQAREYLEELDFLADTAGAQVKKHFLQRLDIPITPPLSEQANWRKLVNTSKHTK